MTDSGDEKTAPNDDSSAARPDDELSVDDSQDDGLYAVSEPEPDASDLGHGATTPVWYLGTADGQREGPLSLSEMKQRVVSGRLGPETLVWRSGMPGWLPAQTVPELFETPATPGSPPPPPLPKGPTAGSVEGLTATAVDSLRLIDETFSSPAAYRMTGRVCAGLGAITFVVALVLLALRWPTWIRWFTGFVLFALIFLIGEAAGAVLEILGRIESQSKAPAEPEEPPQ